MLCVISVLKIAEIKYSNFKHDFLSFLIINVRVIQVVQTNVTSEPRQRSYPHGVFTKMEL